MVVLMLQKPLDRHLDTLLSDAPRRSVLMVDSGKEAADGGYASAHALQILSSDSQSVDINA